MILLLLPFLCFFLENLEKRTRLSKCFLLAACFYSRKGNENPFTGEKQVSVNEFINYERQSINEKVLRNKLTPLQIVITNGYTCSIFQVAKIAKKGVWLCSLFFKTIFRLIIDEVCIISTRYSASFS